MAVAVPAPRSKLSFLMDRRNAPLVLVVYFTIAIFLVLAAVSRVVRAGDSGFYAGVGSVFHNSFKNAATNARGETSAIGPVYPALQGAYRFGDGPWVWTPSVLLTIPGRRDSDEGARRTILALNFAGERDLGGLDARVGTGLLFYSISGDGGTVTLDNGNSFQTFYKPSRSSSSRSILLDLGIGKEFRPEWSAGSFRLDADAWITGVLSRRRAATFVLSASYGI